MKIIIKTKNIEFTSELKDLISNRIGALEKFIKILKEDNVPLKKGKTLSEIFVEVKRETKHHKKGDIFQAEAIIKLPGRNLVAQAHGDDLKKAIIEVKEELEGEIRKYKTKKIDLPRRKARKQDPESF